MNAASLSSSHAANECLFVVCVVPCFSRFCAFLLVLALKPSVEVLASTSLQQEKAMMCLREKNMCVRGDSCRHE